LLTTQSHRRGTWEEKSAVLAPGSGPGLKGNIWWGLPALRVQGSARYDMVRVREDSGDPAIPAFMQMHSRKSLLIHPSHEWINACPGQSPNHFLKVIFAAHS
jgi:hypothetical protein